MELSNSTDLSESVFFTARKARVRSHTHESTGAASSSGVPASSSSGYYSARIHTMMEHMSRLDVTQEDAEIEASRAHWTEVEPECCTAATSVGADSSTSESGSCVEGVLTEAERLRLYEENVEAIRSLQRDNPESRFFQIGDGQVVLGRKIAEGAQGEIFDGGSQYATEEWNDTGKGLPVVLKVFKAGYSVRDLQKQWPLALLHRATPLNENYDDNFNPVICGRLLGDGRFGFEMLRFWGDLRKLLDLRMQLNGNQHPPLMMPDGNYHECCMLAIMIMIAKGMKDLHERDTLHRDLKASNVLVNFGRFFYNQMKEDRLDPMELDHDFFCLVTDYECSIGVVGTGYWRAPEILEVVKNRTWHTTPNVFTPKSDVYSYAMTCYEVLTGFLPFEDIEDMGRTSIDDVLQRKRPKLPSHLRPWMRDLFGKCWHMEPSKRPTFVEILDVFEDIDRNDPCCQSESMFFKMHET
jgi:hypothetical protein